MLKGKTIIISIAVIVIIILVIVFSVNKTNVKISPLLNAVPSNAAIILESNNIIPIIRHLNRDNTMWNTLSKVTDLSELKNQIEFFDTLSSNNSKFKSVLINKPVIISAHLQGKNKIEYLFATQVSNTAEARKLHNVLIDLLRDKSKVVRRTYDNSKIYDVIFNSELKYPTNKELSYSYSNGIFILSFSKVLIENSIRHIHSKNHISDNKSFREVLQTSGKNVQGNIYINYANFSNLLKPLSSRKYLQKNNLIHDFASWTAFDIALRNNSLILAGYTNAQDAPDSYLGLLKNQEAQSNEFIEYLPQQTSGFISLGVSNFMQFKIDFVNYLKLHDLHQKRRYELNQIEKKHQINSEKIFYQLLDERITLAFVDFLRNGNKNQKFVLTKSNDIDKLEDYMVRLCVNPDEPGNEDYKQELFISKNKKLTVYKMQYPNIWYLLFGHYFSDFKCNYICFYDDYIISAQKINPLKNYIISLSLKQNLANDPNYKKYDKVIYQKSNLYFYQNIASSTQLISEHLNKDLKKTFKRKLPLFNNFQAFSLQYSNNKGIFYTNFGVLFNPTRQTKTRSSWSIPLDTISVFKPHLVINHYTNKKEVLTQDLSNKIYLISEDGTILWKKQLSGAIKSEIYQIDYYKNNKLQYLFNTDNYLHLIDRNGNYVENYPIKLPAKSSNELKVYDYDNDGNYRLFIACENKKVYLYSKEGQLVDGWMFKGAKDVVRTPIQHIVIGDRDYLLFADKLDSYILNRRGETRIKTTSNFVKSEHNGFYIDYPKENQSARFVTTNNSGVVQFIYLDGSIKSMKIKNYSHHHYFDYEDIDGNGFKDFIFLDNNILEVYNHKADLIYSHVFKNNTSNAPILFHFSNKDKKIGVVIPHENKIYLINNDGSLYQGFPLNGISPFSIGILDQPEFSLLVGSKDRFLHNYILSYN